MLMMATKKDKTDSGEEKSYKHERGRTDELGWAFCYTHNIMESGE